MNNYIISITLLAIKTASGKKVKMDYSIIPVNKLPSGEYKSDINSQTFEVFKRKQNGIYYNISKKNKCISFYCLISDSREMMEVEEEYLPTACKILEKKLLFKPLFKQKLVKRMNEILGK